MKSLSREEWSDKNHSMNYLKRCNTFPHRSEGEAVLVDLIPKTTSRVLDLGSGDGRLIHLIKDEISRSESNTKIDFVAVDISPTMINLLENNFKMDESVKILEHDLDSSLPMTELGYFDAIISSFAIHHLRHSRKRSIYEEIYDLLNSGGIFCNLEHVSSVSVNQHVKFLNAIGIQLGQGDKTNRLLSVDKQLQMLREIGYVEADCYWKWYEMALIVGFKI